VSDVITIPPLLQLLDQIVKQSYKIKVLAGNQVRIQPKTPDSYRAIIKALAEKNTAFHTYKPKYERNYRVVLKNMHFSINPADIQSKIEKLGHTITNIYNVKHHLTKLPLPMFFVDAKPATNNKDIFNVEYLQQCKIKFEPPKQK
jgi:ribosome-associated translation inhibitor RaiA